jgi:hypothetical protein
LLEQAVSAKRAATLVNVRRFIIKKTVPLNL